MEPKTFWIVPRRVQEDVVKLIGLPFGWRSTYPVDMAEDTPTSLIGCLVYASIGQNDPVYPLRMRLNNHRVLYGVLPGITTPVGLRFSRQDANGMPKATVFYHALGEEQESPVYIGDDKKFPQPKLVLNAKHWGAPPAGVKLDPDQYHAVKLVWNMSPADGHLYAYAFPPH
jgi:hypothetical protein